MGNYMEDTNILVFSFLDFSWVKDNGSEETIHISSVFSVLSKADGVQKGFKELFVGWNERLIKRKQTQKTKLSNPVSTYLAQL